MQNPTGGPRATGIARDLVIAADQAIYVLSRHWLLVANVLAAIYAGLPILSPYLKARGLELAGQLIFVAYRVACHQRPERSFFLFGHQMAYCQRDTATYTAVVLAGIAYALLRPRVKPLPLWGAALLVLPLAVDGTSQFFGLWASTWVSRVITGALFGIALVWLVYPRIDEGLAEIRKEIEARFAKAGLPLPGFKRKA
ncbi:MAG: DUF2085 domain-containing protein [Anaerolineae bacterium]|nr:DUF2085 domain-containing protein [Anaerolineae bacterium]